MNKLSYFEKLKIKIIRNKKDGIKPYTITQIARKFNFSNTYISSVIKDEQKGPASIKLKNEIAEYVGFEYKGEKENEN